MYTNETTCWTVIRAAAAGSPVDREELARRYLGVVRAYLTARWRGSVHQNDLDDATQNVFFECFRQGGALDAVDSSDVPSFRAYLYGIVRNVARRLESRPVPLPGPLPEIEDHEANQSRLFDRTWALTLMKEAAQLQKERANSIGKEALQRIELLRLRFEENLPIRDIAAQWQRDAAELHHAYALARQEFKAALLEVIAFHQPGSAAEAEREATSLLQALS